MREQIPLYIAVVVVRDFLFHTTTPSSFYFPMRACVVASTALLNSDRF